MTIYEAIINALLLALATAISIAAVLALRTKNPMRSFIAMCFGYSVLKEVSE